MVLFVDGAPGVCVQERAKEGHCLLDQPDRAEAAAKLGYVCPGASLSLALASLAWILPTPPLLFCFIVQDSVCTSFIPPSVCAPSVSACAPCRYGGVKYFDLRQNRLSDYEFSYERMLSPDGDTAVYLEVRARCWCAVHLSAVLCAVKVCCPLQYCVVHVWMCAACAVCSVVGMDVDVGGLHAFAAS